jgi:uncharacterized protein
MILMVNSTLGPTAVRASGQGSTLTGAGLVATGIALAAVYLRAATGWRQAALFLVGASAGVILYHAAFGFTSSWRVFIADRRGAGLRAQMLMLALTCAVFFPLLATGSIFGHAVRGSIAPPGVAVIIGAFIFGIGMQLGGGCASGTLFTAGGGDTRMAITLLFFIVGSLLGTAHSAFWTAAPAMPPTSLVVVMGPWAGLMFSLAVFGGIVHATRIVERRAHGRLGDDDPATPRWLRGPWPLMAGAVGLAVVNSATLVISGRPWGVTGAFALWGAKGALAMGLDVTSWPYWSTPAQATALRSSVVTDVTSVMNAGIILGALMASVLASRFRPTWRITRRSLAAAVIGGVLLGYGSRVAYGCNIGAYFSGIASGSLHGWLWLVAGFAGNIAGTSLRPMFDLGVERTRIS